MRTIGIVDGGYTEFLSDALGAYPDFDEYRETKTLPRKRRNDRGTADLAIEALDDVNPDERFFMWVHFFGPHDPDSTHKGVEQWGDTLADRYDHELAFLDQNLGRLLRALDERPDSERIGIIIASDHGEVFGSRRRAHGLTLSEDAIRIPIIARIPGLATGRPNALVSLVDVYPTILSLTETPGPEGLDGMDIRQAAALAERGESRLLLAETWRQAADGSLTVDLVAAFDGSHKLVVDLLHRNRAVVSQTDTRETNLIQEVEFQGLERELLQYLEENTAPNFQE
jgi:arylsulfatase A-like enzyme